MLRRAISKSGLSISRAEDGAAVLLASTKQLRTATRGAKLTLAVPANIQTLSYTQMDYSGIILITTLGIGPSSIISIAQVQVIRATGSLLFSTKMLRFISEGIMRLLDCSIV
jgi:hypothetical protein